MFNDLAGVHLMYHKITNDMIPERVFRLDSQVDMTQEYGVVSPLLDS